MNPTLSDSDYLKKHHIDTLFASIRESLLAERPSNPLDFIHAYMTHVINIRLIKPSREVYSTHSRSLDYDENLVIISPKSLIPSKTVQTESPSPSRILRKEMQRRSSSVARDGRHIMSGMDIGGTLVKITFFEKNLGKDTKESDFVKKQLKYGSTGVRDPQLSFEYDKGRFHFLNFQTSRLKGAIEMLKENKLFEDEEILLATGGGAYKYSDFIMEEFGAKVIKGDELTCCLLGINFFLTNVEDECYYLEDYENPETSLTVPYTTENEFKATDNFQHVYPYLLVNVGSGVSILKVLSEDSFERVSGTPIGGGTYLGLCKLLTLCTTFKEAIEKAKEGDHTNVDMLVGYGNSVQSVHGQGYIRRRLPELQPFGGHCGIMFRESRDA